MAINNIEIAENNVKVMVRRLRHKVDRQVLTQIKYNVYDLGFHKILEPIANQTDIVMNQVLNGK